MKKLLYVFMSVILITGVSCEGEEGPEGPAGPDGLQGPPGTPGLPGEPGEDASAKMFEIGGNLNLENEFTGWVVFEDFDIEINEGDLVFVYKFSGAYTGEDPEDPADDVYYWEPLPVELFQNDTIYVYKYDYSPIDLFIYLKSNFDLTEADINSRYTDNLFFRIAVIPGEIIPPSEGKYLAPVDYNNYEAVIDYYNIDEGNIREIKIE